MERTDSDYGLPWTKGRGLCWKVYQTGKVGWFDRDLDDPAQFGLRDRERQATQHVLAVLSLPIRSAHRPLHPKPTAVLNIDALSAEAVQALREGKEALEAHNNQALVDLVAFAESMGLFKTADSSIGFWRACGTIEDACAGISDARCERHRELLIAG
jgi:hypothetical protein